MIPFLISVLVAAIAEVGDKTQLVAIVLATRFRKPVPILLGIVTATLANHAIAATGGYFLASFLTGAWFQYTVAFSFIAVAGWSLVPAPSNIAPSDSRRGAYLAALISYFVVETGDKTQIATIALAARFHSIALVTLGTTVGIALADAPAVLLAQAFGRYVPLRIVRGAAAVIFLALGLWALADALHA